MGAFVAGEKNPYMKLRDLALLQNASELDAIIVGEDEPYKVLVEFYVAGSPVTVFCAIDGTASLYIGKGAGFINGGAENELIGKIAKSIVFEAKNVIGSMEPVTMFPVVSEGRVNVFVVTERNIYGVTASQEDTAGKAEDIWKIYYLAGEIIGMYMNS